MGCALIKLRGSMPEETSEKDEPDRIGNKPYFSLHDAICPMLGIVFYLADMVLDASTAFTHYYHGDWTAFISTVFLMIVPSFVISAVGVTWDWNDKENRRKNFSKTGWISRIFGSILQLSPVIRYVDILRYGFQSRQAQKDGDKSQQIALYTRCVEEQSDCSLLRLIEGLLEATPQLILQMYLLCQIKDYEYASNYWVYGLWVKCLSSLGSIAWGVSSFTRSLRVSNPDKSNITGCGSIWILLWQICIIGSRVVAYVVCSMEFHIGVIAMVIFHTVVMQIFFLTTSEKKITPYTFFMSAIISLMSSFSFINNEDRRTRMKYIFYYVLCALENATLMVFWLLSADPNLWYYYPGVCLHYGFFIFGLVFMMVYYRFFHPTLSQRFPEPEDSPDAYSDEPFINSGFLDRLKRGTVSREQVIELLDKSLPVPDHSTHLMSKSS